MNLCTTALQKAYNKPCKYCKRIIGYGIYGYVKTKSSTVKGKRIPSKEFYFHEECYLKEEFPSKYPDVAQ